MGIAPPPLRTNPPPRKTSPPLAHQDTEDESDLLPLNHDAHRVSRSVRATGNTAERQLQENISKPSSLLNAALAAATTATAVVDSPRGVHQAQHSPDQSQPPQQQTAASSSPPQRAGAARSYESFAARTSGSPQPTATSLAAAASPVARSAYNIAPPQAQQPRAAAPQAHEEDWSSFLPDGSDMLPQRKAPLKRANFAAAVTATASAATASASAAAGRSSIDQHGSTQSRMSALEEDWSSFLPNEGSISSTDGNTEIVAGQGTEGGGSCASGSHTSIHTIDAITSMYATRSRAQRSQDIKKGSAPSSLQSLRGRVPTKRQQHPRPTSGPQSSGGLHSQFAGSLHSHQSVVQPSELSSVPISHAPGAVLILCNSVLACFNV